jgi:enoyl-CoA hydratase
LVSTLETREDGERLSKQMGETLAEMRALPVISIAVIDGPARGGGAEVAVSCDLRLMSSSATIAFVQTSLGLIPGWGGAHHLYHLVGYAKGIEYLASARVIEANEALQVGLVNAVFPEDQLHAEALNLSREIAANSWDAVRAVKETFLVWEGGSQEAARFSERERFAALWDREERRDIFAKLTRSKKDDL